jgi:hypothetical protein
MRARRRREAVMRCDLISLSGSARPPRRCSLTPSVLQHRQATPAARPGRPVRLGSTHKRYAPSPSPDSPAPAASQPPAGMTQNERAMEERGEKKTQDSPQLTLSAARLFPRGRCGQCLPCRQVKHKQACVRSLSRRGHQGALLTLLGVSAIGVRVEVFWELDAAWYAGAVTAYDVHTSKHTLRYDLDGGDHPSLATEGRSRP